MKVEVKKVDPVRRELRFEVPKERVSKKLEEIYKSLGKVAKVKGFRPGKVPRQILESQHSNIAQEEVVKQLIPEVYQEALKLENISPIDLPEIHDVNLKDGIMTFTAKLDVKPDIQIKDYKEIKIQRKTSQVTEDELAKTLEYFKKGKGDKEVTIDDAFARGLGYPTLEEFKSSLRRQLETDKDHHNRMDVENQIIETLLKKTRVTVPQSLLTRQFERRLHDMEHRLKDQGVPAEEIKKKLESAQDDLKKAIEKDIAVYLILDKIAETEKIEAPEGENLPAKVLEFLMKEAKWES